MFPTDVPHKISYISTKEYQERPYVLSRRNTAAWRTTKRLINTIDGVDNSSLIFKMTYYLQHLLKLHEH